MATSAALAIFAICLSCLVSIDAASKPRHGFSVELINRDSPKSPFYKPDETHSQRLANALRRSISRSHHFNRKINAESPTTVESEIFNVQGEFLMKLSVGTPPFEILAIADTGSDLIWTQCQPCDQCYQQDAPIFDPKSSSTYRDLSCTSSQCERVNDQSKCDVNQHCYYTYAYGDSSSTSGNFAAETITLDSTSGRPVNFPKSLFGCGHDNSGTFGAQGSGLVGLGGGSISLISQLGSSIDGKFSYCLVPVSSTATSNSSSKLNFGSNAVVSGEGAVSTPLTKKEPDTFYFLTLEAISVGEKRIEFPGSSFGASDGNIIIDSGTTLTLVPQDFYSELESAVESASNGRRVQDPTSTLSLCYAADNNLEVPVLTAHFSGADVELKTINTFIQVSEGVVCLAFIANDSIAIFGYIAQLNHLVGYDIQENTVSFKPTDCTKE
ncbi:aspartic proteinase CDR1 [Manihot esculenta]|uniref:Peptidase A1 domain-containing protein n=1 Tax=Manihot esculenta TaxID=3983 RepID=A0A2C9VAG7_MANES|nr:aspartic proteinase CDR1 [Manihot esculenta]OAY41833.1 hypothetical protein MANES_09G132700v8 [Manihot esculenta]